MSSWGHANIELRFHVAHPFFLASVHTGPCVTCSCTLQIQNAHGGAPALTVAGSSTGVFATCGQKTDMRVFSSSGKQLASLDSAGLTNHGIAFSENGQFLAAATFTADVKVKA